MMRSLNDVDLYPVITEAFCGGRSSEMVLQEVLKGGARMVQLREKEMSKRQFYEVACRYRALTADHGTILIINDHLDVAMAVGADGVHIGQDDLPLTAARKVAPDMIIGVSTHSREEAEIAVAQGASYINIGPIFSTKTKEKLSEFLGPDRIPDISRDIDIPFTVMGGINATNIQQVLDAGARHIAMVTAITRAEDIAGTVHRFRSIIAGG